MTPTATVSEHAGKRLKQRLSLPRKAWVAHAQRVLDKGKDRTKVRGNARAYLDKLYFENRETMAVRVYGEFVYLFCESNLVTVLRLKRGGRKV